MKKSVLKLFSVLFLVSEISAQEIRYTPLALDSTFDTYQGTVVLYDLKNKEYRISDFTRADSAFSVHSTSKIFFSIIALEENLVDGNNLMIWDSTKYHRKDMLREEWAGDQNIVSALKYSVNWYYIELLQLMTPQLIQDYLNKLDYQQNFKVEANHYFGLSFNIKKSAIEQVEFLKSFYLNEFNLKDETCRLIKEGIFNSESGGRRLYIRTGMGPVEADTGIGWFIGFVEKEDNAYFFAANIENDDLFRARELCREFVLKFLDLYGIFKQEKK